MSNITILSDNAKFLEDLSEQISLYAPEYAGSINNADAVPDVIVLDEKADDVNVLKNTYPHTPIFILCPKESEKKPDTALIKHEIKPLILTSFINKLQAAVNLAANSEAGHLNFNDYELRPASKEILNLRNNEIVKLTEKEVAIIQYLYKIKGRIVSKIELLQEVWGYRPDVTTHTIETHIYRLRQKVEKDDPKAQLIVTEDGGYALKR